MITHVVRQERSGGILFDRDAGRAHDLSPAGFRLLGRLHGELGRIDAKERARLETDVPGPERALISSVDRGMEAWRQIRLVPGDVPAERLPADASSAPKRIYFEITRGCNLHCRTCFNDSHHPLPDELTLEEISSVHQQAFDLGVFEMRYTGGECTTRPGFADIVSDARKRGFYISIGTNGVYSDEQLEWLPHSGIDWFIVSVDGDAEVHDKVRGRGSFDRVARTLRVLGGMPKIRLRLNMTVARHNVKQIEAVARTAKEHGVESLNLIPLRPYGRAAKSMLPLMFDGAGYYDYVREVRRLRKEVPGLEFITAMDVEDPLATTSRDRLVQKKETCAAGVEACVIGPLGHVFGCSYSPASFPDHATEEEHRLFIPGNIRDEALRVIWRDSSRWSVFRDLARSKNEKCVSCSHYKVRCTGSCQIMSYYEQRHRREAAEGVAELRDFHDPYCPKEAFELLREEGGSTPCKGVGM